MDTARAVGFIERLATDCTRVLGETVCSVILHGSLALGDYVPGQSDVDLLAIVDGPLGRVLSEELARALAGEQAAALSRVDFRVVTREVAAAPPEVPPMELSVGLHPSAEPEVVSCHPGEPDLIVELSLCRDRGTALMGAAPRDLIGEIPDRWVVRVGDAQLARWQALTDDASHAVLMVLTACRVWRFAETRSHCSKSEAGAWALTRDPSLHAVRAALRRRAGGAARIEPADIARLLSIARVETAAAWPR